MVVPSANGLSAASSSVVGNGCKSSKNSSLLHQSLHNSFVLHEDEQLDSASALAVSIANGKTFSTVFALARDSFICV